MSTKASGAVTRAIAPGEYLFHEGDVSNSIFIIQKGTLSIRKRKASAYVEIARIYTHEILGELSFFDRQPRSAAAIALTDTEVIEIKFDALDKVYSTTPDYFKAIMVSIADRLRKADDTIRRLQREVVKDEESTPEVAANPPAATEKSPESTPAAADEPKEKAQAKSKDKSKEK